MSTTPTALDDAVGNDDERVCGQWRDQWDNEYVVTRCQSSYSVVVRYLQRCKKQGTTQTFEGSINRDTNGQYTWGNPTISHELHIRDETVLEWRAKPKGTKKIGSGVEFVGRGCSSMHMKRVGFLQCVNCSNAWRSVSEVH